MIAFRTLHKPNEIKNIDHDLKKKDNETDG